MKKGRNGVKIAALLTQVHKTQIEEYPAMSRILQTSQNILFAACPSD